MCGRFTLRTPAKVIAEQFGLLPIDQRITTLTPRYNIAPTQQLFAIRRPSGSDRRQAVMLHWGLIPSWAKDRSIGNRMINARAETVDSKPSFRKAFRVRRCLIIADGYYEWQKTGGAKQPYYFHRPDDQPFAFAGLWESWSGQCEAEEREAEEREAEEREAEEKVESCTIITTAANDLSRDIHDRMPVVLDESSCDAWLDCDQEDLDRLKNLLRPASNDLLVADPVSTLVNKPTNDSPACIEPSSTGLETGLE